MYKSYNPFFKIIETKNFPLSRILRTSFHEKLGDGFAVFYGTESHPGILQYLTLFSNDYLSEKVNASSGRLHKILFYINKSLQLLMIGAATLLTLMVSPIIAIVHGLSLAIKYFYFEDYNVERILDIQGYKIEYKQGQAQGHRQAPQLSLRDYLDEHRMGIDNIFIRGIKGKINSAKFDLMIQLCSHPDESLIEEHSFCTNHIENPAMTTEGFANFRRNVMPFFRLNISNNTSNLESQALFFTP